MAARDAELTGYYSTVPTMEPMPSFQEVVDADLHSQVDTSAQFLIPVAGKAAAVQPKHIGGPMRTTLLQGPYRVHMNAAYGHKVTNQLADTYWAIAHGRPTKKTSKPAHTPKFS